MRALRIIIMVLVAAAFFPIALAMGTSELNLTEVLTVLFVGNGDSAVQRIVFDVRLPRVLMAVLTGAALGVSGLLMQTIFRNPLAGPSVLGISSGSALGVALVSLALAGISGVSVVTAAVVGALACLILILFADLRTRNSVTLLIVGLMIGYFCSAIISILQYRAEASGLKGFIHWGFGTFDTVSMQDLALLTPIVVVGIALCWGTSKSLNALLLGEEQALLLGVPVKGVKRLVLVVVGILVACITAYAGPIAFLGMAVPHLARAFLRTSNHRHLIPAVIFAGAVLAMMGDAIRHLPHQGTLPLNAVFSMIGVPVILWILLKGRSWSSDS